MKTKTAWPGVVAIIGGALFCCFLLRPEAAARAQMTDVLTFHNDAARTGQATNEQVLTPCNVNSNLFGKLWELPVDGQVYAEPLYAAGISIPGHGQRNVVFVATENDSVYAFDADSTNVFWHISVLGSGEEPFQTNSCTITPQIGITATPVIDRSLGANGTIFVEAMSQTFSGIVYQRLHALDLATGQDTVPPVAINATYPGTGQNSFNGTIVFNPIFYVDRASLLLVNGVVYFGFSAHCNVPPTTSWFMGYDEHTLAQTSVIDLTADGGLGSIWNSGAGPAADTSGNIYVVMGDGILAALEGGPVNANGFPINECYGNAMVKLSTTNNSLVVTDYFMEYNVKSEDEEDLDLGSGSGVVLPAMTDAQGNIRHLVVTAGKDQNIYLADCTNMGKFNSSNNNALYQEVTNVFTDPKGDPPNNYGLAGGIWSSAAYFNGALYFGPVNGPVTAFPFVNARLGASTSKAASIFKYPGATPSISANGAANGIVWAVEILGSGILTASDGAILHAYAATNLADELYNSNQATNRDNFGSGEKFCTPMIASARVYVATPTNGVAVFGLLDQSSLTPIEQWRNGNFGNPCNVGAGADSASPADDGVANLIKYALGLNPFTPVTPDQLQTAGIQQSGGQSYLTLTVNRAANPSDVNVATQVSSDLQTWNSGPSYTTTLTSNATQLVISYNTPIGGAKGFMRLLYTPVTNP